MRQFGSSAKKLNRTNITYARRTADREKIRYTNIDISESEREAAGIPRNYLELPEDQQMPLHRIREQYFYEQVIKHFAPGSDVLVVCGRTHAGRLRDLFAQHGFQVELIELSEQEGFDWEWFVPKFGGF